MNTTTLQNESEKSNSFIKFPKKLIYEQRYKDISYGAKLLYAMLCDRMSLSEANAWEDENGEIFIYYSIKAICEDLRCCKDSVRKLLSELESASLICRKRVGMGTPNRIYVTKLDEPNENTDINRAEKPTSRGRKNSHQYDEKTAPNKTEINKTELSKTENNNTHITIACEVLDYLNKKTKKNFLLNNKNFALIFDRLSEGYQKEDFIHAIDAKYEDWYNTDKEKYLRPSTLFKEEHFDNYVNERIFNPIKTNKTRLEAEHDYDIELLEKALFGG